MRHGTDPAKNHGASSAHCNSDLLAPVATYRLPHARSVRDHLRDERPYARRRQPERPRSLASGLAYGRAAVQVMLALEEELELHGFVGHQFRGEAPWSPHMAEQSESLCCMEAKFVQPILDPAPRPAHEAVIDRRR